MLEDTAINLHTYAQMALNVVVPALVTVLGTFVTVGVSRANAWLRSKVHNESFQCASNRLDKLVGDAVAEAERTLVRDYRDAAADGVLSREDGEKVRDGVVDVVKRHLGDKGQKELLGCLGHTDFSVIEGMIRTRIEAAVGRAKSEVASVVETTTIDATIDDEPAIPPRSVASGPGPSGVKPAPKG